MSWEADTEAVVLTSEQEAQLRSISVSRASDSLRALENATTDEEDFYALPDAAMGAFQLGDLQRAQQLALQVLALAPSYEQNWNYGNAIHFGHTALGLVALAEGDVTEAVSELTKAGSTPGSPQLDSFGPTMQLAKALLQQGQFTAVLAYVQSCRSFWKMGATWLDLWEATIRSGGVPNCFMHAYR
jgi:hypothetical protein